MLKQRRHDIGESTVMNRFASGPLTKAKKADIERGFKRKPKLSTDMRKRPFGKKISYTLPPLTECKPFNGRPRCQIN